MDKVVRSLAELEQEARSVARSLRSRADSATLVTLSGELGAGKTAFTKAVAQELGVEEVVNSPTFVIAKVYALPREVAKGGFARLIHLDAYRLESGKQLEPLHFSDMLADPNNLILLEWPEQVADTLPRPTLHIAIVTEADDARRISYEEA